MIFKRGKIINGLKNDKYSKSNPSMWDFYSKYGTKNYEQLTAKFKNCTIYNVKDIIEL